MMVNGYFAISAYGNDQIHNVNFGNPSVSITSGNTDGNGYGNFEYSTKGGYALCTKKPSGVWIMALHSLHSCKEIKGHKGFIMAYTTIDDPSAYFQTALYTGDGNAQTITNDGNF